MTKAKKTKKPKATKPRTKPARKATASTPPAPPPAQPVAVPVVVVGGTYRLLVDPMRPGFVTLAPEVPFPMAGERDATVARPTSVLVRARENIVLRKYWSEGHVSVARGGIAEVYVGGENYPPEFEELHARGAVELVARHQEILPVHGLRSAPWCDPTDSGLPWDATRPPRLLSIADRERQEGHC